MHVGIANQPWWGKRSRHPRRMLNTQFCVSGKRPMASNETDALPTVQSRHPDIGVINISNNIFEGFSICARNHMIRHQMSIKCHNVNYSPTPFVLVFTGTHCEVDNINACSSGPCMNNASCENTIAFPDGFKCYCNNIGDTVYTGDRCQTSTDVCSVPDNACMNDGTCVPIASFRRHCDCKPGYTGDKCETDIGRIDVIIIIIIMGIYNAQTYPA